MIAMLLGGVVGLREIFGVTPVVTDFPLEMDIAGYMPTDIVHLLETLWCVINVIQAMKT